MASALGNNPFLQGRYELIMATRGGYSSPQAWVAAGNRSRHQRRARNMGMGYVDYLVDYVKGTGASERIATVHRSRKSGKKARSGKAWGKIGEAGAAVAGGALSGIFEGAVPEDLGWYAKWGAAGVIGVVLVGGGAIYYATRK